MRVLILGGTGVLSRAIVDRLLLDKHEVAIFNRGSKELSFNGEVRQLVGDRMNREAFESAMAKERFDAVIDMICFNEADARSTVRAFKGRVGQLVICSSIAAYKRPYRSVPTVEAAESLHDDPVFAYAFHKAEVERYLWGVIAAEKLPITLIRPSLTYGPGVINMGVLRQNYGIVHRIRQGKPLVMFGDGSTPWSFTFAPDLAKGFAGVLGNPATYGQAYHVTSEERSIWEDLYLTFGKIVGKTPRIVHIPSALLHKAAPNLCGHLSWEKTYAGLFDNSKIKRDVPGYKAEISLEEGLKTIVAWYEREAHTVDPEKDALEDTLVSLYQRWEAEIADLYTK
jgi:nucleoside-diphosphate-sugar epimerase